MLNRTELPSSIHSTSDRSRSGYDYMQVVLGFIVLIVKEGHVFVTKNLTSE